MLSKFFISGTDIFRQYCIVLKYPYVQMMFKIVTKRGQNQDFIRYNSLIETRT